MKTPYKVKVPNKDDLLVVFPGRVNSNISENYKGGNLLDIILFNLYTKSILGDEKILISKLANDFDRKEIYEIYLDIILDLEDYKKGFRKWKIFNHSDK